MSTFTDVLLFYGILNVGSGNSDISPDVVKDGVNLGSGLYGNRVDAPVGDVVLGVHYGAQGTSLTGTYRAPVKEISLGDGVSVRPVVSLENGV